MVYLLEHTERLSLPALLPLVSEQRQKKITALRNEEDKGNSVAAFLLLRYGLFREYGIREMPRLIPDASGKPGLQWPHIHFNLSHSGTAAACALSREAVGVDIQKVTPCQPAVMRRVFSEPECCAVEAASDPDGLFAAIWSRKEAYGKALGMGIRYPMKERDFSVPCAIEGFQITTRIFGDYVLSLCAKEPLEIQIVEDIL